MSALLTDLYQLTMLQAYLEEGMDDSGDLAAHARAVRVLLDEGRLASTTIFASGNLDESRIDELVASTRHR